MKVRGNFKSQTSFCQRFGFSIIYNIKENVSLVNWWVPDVDLWPTDDLHFNRIKKNTFVFYFKEDTISINHNWTNACGIYKMWEHLQSELSKVSWMISDKRVRLTTGTINRELTWKSQTETFLYGWMSVVSRTSKSFRLHDLSRFAHIKVVLPVNSVIVNKLKSFH